MCDSLNHCERKAWNPARAWQGRVHRVHLILIIVHPSCPFHLQLLARIDLLYVGAWELALGRDTGSSTAASGRPGAMCPVSFYSLAASLFLGDGRHAWLAGNARWTTLLAEFKTWARHARVGTTTHAWSVHHLGER